jgi:deazaflavin-dependent oxidoreductase (nitroreductase family)
MAVEIPPPGTRGAPASPLSPALSSALMWVLVVVYHLLGRWVRIDGLPLILLTTVGARTGKKRQTLLMGFPWGEDQWVILASSMGMAKNPAWLFNLARNPDNVTVEVGGQPMTVRARTLTAEERAEAWPRITARSGRFADYREKTDREIPIILLTRRAQ